ncbi:MAG: XdhC family protein [Candidatus Eremiobacteraeota bacterium]|nr:XdhC family protein [Candidatus Eremiobacteraeota bacterium]
MNSELFELCRLELASGRPVVRAVIVRTWGSTPRETGADMVLDAAGGLRGTVGGGCGEAEVYELGQELLADPEAAGALLHVDLTEDPEEGGGKVCGGRFDVLLHKLQPEVEGALVNDVLERVARGETLEWVTEMGEARPGFWKQGLVQLPFHPKARVSRLTSPEVRLSEEPEGCLFSEPVGLARTLVVVGAGHIARPLCVMAAEAGYQVVVLDDRAEYADKKFFPAANRVESGPYQELLPELASGPLTSVVLVTRGHRHDQDCLRLIAEYELEYIGMIGSQRRVDAVFAELVEEGVSADALREVCAPIGLEIGAQTPAEIACCILAQMIKYRRRDGEKSRFPEDRKRNTKALKCS